jgi:hypothetical protein
MPSSTDSRRASMLQLRARSAPVIFHIGPEIVDCLMRKRNSAETVRDSPEQQSQLESRGGSRLQGSRIARLPWIVGTLASALRRLL